MCEIAIGTWAAGVWGINAINLQYNRYFSVTYSIHEIFAQGTYRMQFDMKCPNRESSRPVSKYSSQNGVRLTRVFLKSENDIHWCLKNELIYPPGMSQISYYHTAHAREVKYPQQWFHEASFRLHDRNSGVHVVLPDLAWMGLWMSVNLHSLENICRVRKCYKCQMPPVSNIMDSATQKQHLPLC